jgi:hypothetical protein
MSKFFFSLVVVAFLLGGIGGKCFAESNVLSSLSSNKKENSKKDEAARAAFRKIILEKKAELNGSSWSVKIESQSGKGDFLGQDTLIFQNDRFRSERAGKLDYGPTNYTLTVQEQGPTIWETMQTSKKGEVSFWRGEWKEGVMTGIVSRQLEKGNEEYYFTSASRKEIPKTSEEKEEAKINPAKEKEVEAVTSDVLGGAPVPKAKAAPAKDKKKTSWF